MAGDYDYAPVGITDDDEELLRNGYAPVTPPAVDSPPAGVADPQMAMPPVSSSTPLAGSASPAPVVGSLDDLEARAARPGVYRGPDVTPPAPRPQWKDYAPPEMHGVKRGLGALFTGLAAFRSPELGRQVYDELYNDPQRRAEEAYKNATAEYDAPQSEADREAQTEERETASERNRAEADKLRQPPEPKQEEAGKTITTDQGIFQWNPLTERYDIRAGGAPAKNEKPDSLDQQYNDAIASGDHAAAARILKVKEDLARAGQKPERPQRQLAVMNGRVVELVPGMDATGAESIGGLEKAGAAKKKDLEPLQTTLDEIAESREFAAAPSATNDYGLLMNFIGVTKPESLAKLRLNQNEVALAKGTRGILGDLNALRQKVADGESLTPDQRQEMLKTMGIIEKFTQRRIGVLNGSGGGEGGHIIHIGADRYQYKGTGDTSDLANYTKLPAPK